MSDNLNVFSQVTQMIMLYNGMFYITGSEKWYMDPDSGIDWLFMIIIFVPSIGFLIKWMNAIKTQFLIILFVNNPELFKVITFNLVDTVKFKNDHLEADIIEIQDMEDD